MGRKTERQKEARSLMPTGDKKCSQPLSPLLGFCLFFLFCVLLFFSFFVFLFFFFLLSLLTFEEGAPRFVGLKAIGNKITPGRVGQTHKLGSWSVKSVWDK